ncbi:MAG: tetratricopeptide repeat protein, partial [bacterium]|nr:tetratricopeptide repeat protein [bacterium]
MKSRTLLPIMAALLAWTGCSRDPEALKQRYLELGNKYHDRGQYKESSILYRKALQQDGLFAEAYYRLGLAEIELGRYPTAGAAFLRAFQLNTTNVDAFRRVAEMQLIKLAQPGAPREGLRVLIDLTETAERDNPENFDIVRIKGLLARLQGNRDEAILLFRQALELNPSNPQGVIALAESLLVKGQFEEVETLAKASLAEDPSFNRMYDILYVLSLRQDRPEQAEAILRQKVANSPKVSEYRLQLAGHHMRAGNRARMEATLDSLTENPEEFPNGHELVGDFYVRIGEAQKAIDSYQRGRITSSDTEQVTNLTYKIVIALAADRRWEAASAMVEELLVQDPEDSRGLSLRSALRLRTGDPDEVRSAIQDLERLIRLEPNNAVIRYRLGQAYAALEDSHSARQQYLESSRLEPGFLPPKHELMRIHLARGEFTQAVVVANEILEKHPNDPTSRLMRGVAHIALSEYETARSDLEAVSARGPNSGDAAFHLARLDIREGKLREAERRLQELRAANPADDRARRGLAELYAATGNLVRAQEMLEARIKQAPERMDHRLDLVRYVVRLGNVDRGLEELNKILDAQPDHKMAHTLLGEIMLDRGDNDTARRHFEAGIAG